MKVEVLLPDALWEEIRVILPPPKQRRTRYPGRKPMDPRHALLGILFVLRSGIPWEMLPQELGCGSGMTCWRYLNAWQVAGVWKKIHQVLLSRLRGSHKMDFSRAVIDSSSVRAALGGAKTGPNPTDRRKSGTKHHIITEAQGIPLAVQVTEANRHDVTALLPLVEAIPPIGGKRGRPQRRPASLLGDAGYNSGFHRRELRRRLIRPLIRQRGSRHGSGLGKSRWVVERTLSWLHQNRRLRVRYEKRADIHEAFLILGCIMICWSALASWSPLC